MDVKPGRNSVQGSHFGDWIGTLTTSVKTQNIVALLIILAFAAINIASVIRGFSLTTDEDKHILYGERIAAGDSTRIDDSKMPITALNALPKKLAAFLKNEKIKQVLARLYVARMVTIFFSCLLAWLVFNWSRSLYGFVPALFSLGLYVLDPNIIAHSQLVTTDLYVTCAMTFAFFSLWKFLHERTFKNGFWCLFALGVSQIAKYTAIVLYPLFFIALLIYDLPAWRHAIQEKKELKALILTYLKYGAFAGLASILIINLGFLFNGTLTNFGAYTFSSDVFNNIQARFPILQRLPVPVPYPYLHGLDWMRNTEQTGNLSGNVYLLGKISTLKGFPGYYFVAAFLKTPIATQIILLLAFVAYFMHKERRANLMIDEQFLLIPVLFFTIYFNFFFNTQIGIRYFLPVYPLLYVFAGNLFIGWGKFSAGQKTASLALIVYIFVSVFSYYPYCISYFNEFVWNRKSAYKYLADSNIDWGQGRNELDQYLLQHPSTIYKPGKARSGDIVVRVNDLVGVTADPDQYAWLRNNFEPIDTIAYAYLVYKISPEEINKLCTTTSYCNK